MGTAFVASPVVSLPFETPAPVYQPVAIWYDSATVCAIADSERHLGHVQRSGDIWAAYDGTHADEERGGFLQVGLFSSVTAAKLAVEKAVGRYGSWWAGKIPGPTQ
jgi:hypothetical protein